MGLPKEITELSELFSSLPGVGPKLSTRIALYLAVNGKNLAKRLSENLNITVDKVKTCKVCNNITTTDLCEICTDEKRDQSRILVIEDSLDLYNLEFSEGYNGLYHVLGGVISPINGIGPDELSIPQLLDRAKTNKELKEIVFALNPNLEGDSTSLYIKEEVQNINPEIEFTQIAKGIPSGGDIEFASSQTLVNSVNSRVKF